MIQHISQGGNNIMTLIYDISKLDKETQDLIKNDYYDLFTRFPKNLFSIGADTKTVKGQELNVLTGIQYLAPYKISGVNVCASAGVAKCHIGCLNTAGRGKFTSNQIARLRKTLFMQQYPKTYKILFRKEIDRLVRKAERMDMVPMVRPNGTSDIRYELFMSDVFKDYPNVQFYDYTKLPNRPLDIKNYDLTFSYSGVKEYQPLVKKALERNMRMAVVFRNKDNQPKTFMGRKVINGDKTDIRPYDKQGVIVALYAKGDAVKDTTGFVVDNNNINFYNGSK